MEPSACPRSERSSVMARGDVDKNAQMFWALYERKGGAG